MVLYLGPKLSGPPWLGSRGGEGGLGKGRGEEGEAPSVFFSWKRAAPNSTLFNIL